MMFSQRNMGWCNERLCVLNKPQTLLNSRHYKLQTFHQPQLELQTVSFYRRWIISLFVAFIWGHTNIADVYNLIHLPKEQTYDISHITSKEGAARDTERLWIRPMRGVGIYACAIWWHSILLESKNDRLLQSIILTWKAWT